MIAVGDTVTVSWDVDPAYGGMRQTFKGVVRKIDDWITVANSRSTFHYPLSVLAGVHVEQSAASAANPFMQSNPFMQQVREENPFMKPNDNPFMR